MRQTVDKPHLGEILHPGTAEGNHLPAKEETEFAVAQGRKSGRQLVYVRTDRLK